MDITNDGLVPKVNPFQENIKFWDNIYETFMHIFKNADMLKKDQF